MNASPLRFFFALLALLIGVRALPAQEVIVQAERRNAPAQQAKPYVVLVSLDGFHPGYVKSVPAPRIARLRREGVSAPYMIPVFPTKTFPNHYSIVTGMYPGRHGIVGNQMWDPVLRDSFKVGHLASERDPRWYGGEPVWVTAERQGMLSAALYWPGSQVPIGGVLPAYHARYDQSVTSATRMDQVLRWLRLPPDRRPHLVTVYISEVDEGHHPPGSPQVRAAVGRVDEAVSRLLDGIARLPIAGQVNVVLVSDHGMQDVRNGRTEYLSDHIPLQGVRVVGTGPTTSLFFDGDTAALERARTALRAGLNAAGVYRRSEIPARYRLGASPRAGDLLVEMRAPDLVAIRRRPGAPKGDPANHGYDPRTPSMRAFFAANGPAFRPRTRVPAFENVHIYPLLTTILRLRPNPAIDGRAPVLAPLLRPR
ncbi:MAG: Alkaline phosphodiesterase I / Nucleotide pyrophosphatase [uncultured Gemmatimonadetes bacterium]|uniref:Alkaline phosphodiesterase I / Nucleotide pyrophosphatase n=1 Tax=uncultured Gemmatimonadota bacterium TaxID=203437 RepID=A0A6J4KSC1_9BACT|nr:MAG: Alkaline phosphodiesterase I / Nucleotide pyrophosphatase [uncultured Gemmatimonadota bacterium]